VNASTAHDRDVDCSTTKSFDDHGLGDGSRLIRRTCYRLLDGGTTAFEPSDRFDDRLESAFIRTDIGATDDWELPPLVEAPVDGGLARTKDAFGDRPNGDLRTEVVPAIYQRVAGYHCAYR
jgi:hypothetical protein